MKRAGSSAGVWLAFAAAAVLLGGLYIWRGGISLLFLLLLLGCLLIQGCVFLLAGPKKFKVVRTWSPLFPQAGQDVTVELTVRVSGGRAPIWLRVHEEFKEQGSFGHGMSGRNYVDDIFFAGMNREYKGTYTLQELKRGIYKPDQVQLAWGDPFGWFRRVQTVAVEDTMIVHPAPLQAELPVIRGLSPEETGLNSAYRQPSSSSALGRLRPYEQGDPLRLIHWKSSAKSGELLTRIPDETGWGPQVLLLDAESGSYPSASNGENELFEYAVSAIASWIVRGSGSGEFMELYFGHSQMGSLLSLSGDEGKMSALELLARLTPRVNLLRNTVGTVNGYPLDVLLGRSVAMNSRVRLTIITGRITKDIAASILQFVERGGKTELWCMSRAVTQDEVKLAASLQEAGVAVITIDSILAPSAHKRGDRYVSA